MDTLFRWQGDVNPFFLFGVMLTSNISSGSPSLSLHSRLIREILVSRLHLGTRVLISTSSKVPHYSPHDPKAHEPDTSNRDKRDEIGLVRGMR